MPNVGKPQKSVFFAVCRLLPVTSQRLSRCHNLGTLQGFKIEGFKDFSRHFSKWCDIFQKSRHFFCKMARHFSENLVTTFLKTTVKYGTFAKSCRDIFGLSSMYRRYHVHFQLIFEPFYFEPFGRSIRCGAWLAGR